MRTHLILSVILGVSWFTALSLSVAGIVPPTIVTKQLTNVLCGVAKTDGVSSTYPVASYVKGILEHKLGPFPLRVIGNQREYILLSLDENLYSGDKQDWFNLQTYYRDYREDSWHEYAWPVVIRAQTMPC